MSCLVLSKHYVSSLENKNILEIQEFHQLLGMEFKRQPPIVQQLYFKKYDFKHPVSISLLTSRESQKQHWTGPPLVSHPPQKGGSPVPDAGISGKSCFLTQGPAPPASCRPPTCLAGDDHGLHGQLEELVQHQVQEEHQGLQARGVEADDAELQLVLQRRLADLLVQHADGEGHLALQGVAQSEELLQVVVLRRQTAGLTGRIPSGFDSGLVNTTKHPLPTF